MPQARPVCQVAGFDFYKVLYFCNTCRFKKPIAVWVHANPYCYKSLKTIRFMFLVDSTKKHPDLILPLHYGYEESVDVVVCRRQQQCVSAAVG